MFREWFGIGLANGLGMGSRNGLVNGSGIGLGNSLGTGLGNCLGIGLFIILFKKLTYFIKQNDRSPDLDLCRISTCTS